MTPDELLATLKLRITKATAFRHYLEELQEKHHSGKGLSASEVLDLERAYRHPEWDDVDTDERIW